MVTEGEFAMHYKFGDNLCGISKQAIASATATQRLAVLDADMQGIQQLKAIPEFNARFVFITPPSLEVSKARLMPKHSEAGEIQVSEPLVESTATLGSIRSTEHEKQELEYACTPGTYDLILSSDNLDDAFHSLVHFIHSSESYTME